MQPRNLPSEWAHLARWWAIHHNRYNLSALARKVGTSKTTLSVLLRDPSTPNRNASAELLARITAALATNYTPAP